MRNSSMTAAAGWSMIGIAGLHTAFFLPQVPWAAWLAGDLWYGAASPAAYMNFWALPGGFTVVLALLGLQTVRMARTGQAAPGYLGWTIGIWAAGCVLLIGPSGFLLGLIPAGLLIAADLRERMPAS